MRSIAKLRILIPAHNESRRIIPVLNDYCRAFRDDAVITVIANACTDDTVDVVESLMTEYPNLHVLTINGRIGKGGAVRAGFKVGGEQFVGFTDADGSTSAQQFEALWEYCRRNQADGVIGSRWSNESVVDPPQPAMRRIASRCFNGIVRLFFGLRFRDTQCGAKVFRRSALAEALWRLELADFAFDIDLLYQLKRSRKRVLEMPIQWSDSSGSKVRIIPASLSMLASVVRLKLRNSRARSLPFIEYIGRRTAIPVRQPLRFLILNRREDLAGSDVQRCLEASVAALAGAGYRVEWVDDVLKNRLAAGFFARVFDRLALLRWYTLGTDRPYDGLIEMETAAPSGIPAFSVKPTFLLRPAETALPVIYSFYRSTILSIDERSTAADVCEAICGGAQNGLIYSAAFRENEAAWTLRFSDIESGLIRHTELK